MALKEFIEPQISIIYINNNVETLSSEEGLKPIIDPETGYGSLIG